MPRRNVLAVMLSGRGRGDRAVPPQTAQAPHDDPSRLPTSDIPVPTRGGPDDRGNGPLQGERLIVLVGLDLEGDRPDRIRPVDLAEERGRLPDDIAWSQRQDALLRATEEAALDGPAAQMKEHVEIGFAQLPEVLVPELSGGSHDVGARERRSDVHLLQRVLVRLLQTAVDGAVDLPEQVPPIGLAPARPTSLCVSHRHDRYVEERGGPNSGDDLVDPARHDKGLEHHGHAQRTADLLRGWRRRDRGHGERGLRSTFDPRPLHFPAATSSMLRPTG